MVKGSEVAPIDVDNKVEELAFCDVEALNQAKFAEHGEDDAVDLWQCVIPDIEVKAYWLDLSRQKSEHRLEVDVGERKRGTEGA